MDKETFMVEISIGMLSNNSGERFLGPQYTDWDVLNMHTIENNSWIHSNFMQFKNVLKNI